MFGKDLKIEKLMLFFAERGKGYKENEEAELKKILRTVEKNKQFHDDIVKYLEEKEATERLKKYQEELNKPAVIDLIESAAPLQSHHNKF